MGVSINGGTPKWMVCSEKTEKTLWKMDEFGVPHSWKHSYGVLISCFRWFFLPVNQSLPRSPCSKGKEASHILGACQRCRVEVRCAPWGSWKFMEIWQRITTSICWPHCTSHLIHLATQWPQWDAIQIAGKTETDLRPSKRLRESFSASDQCVSIEPSIKADFNQLPTGTLQWCAFLCVWNCGSCQQLSLKHLKHE